LLDRATRLDPGFAFYYLQKGYVYSVLAAESPKVGHLAQAAKAYERGIALEPNFSLNHANLSNLYWTAGRWDEAISEMERAVQLAPRSPLYHLNLGHYYEATAREKKAAAEYERLLELQSHLIPASYWRQTPFRQQFTEHQPRDCPRPGDGPHGPGQL
jgi:tetratricopeptide (TPR) repeat protein